MRSAKLHSQADHPRAPSRTLSTSARRPNVCIGIIQRSGFHIAQNVAGQPYCHLRPPSPALANFPANGSRQGLDWTVDLPRTSWLMNRLVDCTQTYDPGFGRITLLVRGDGLRLFRGGGGLPRRRLPHRLRRLTDRIQCGAASRTSTSDSRLSNKFGSERVEFSDELRKTSPGILECMA